MANMACKRVSHNALLCKSPTYAVNDSIYDFDWEKLHCGNVVNLPYWSYAIFSCVCLQGNPMFVTTVTIGNFTASCYPQPSQFAAVDIASYQLIQGIQKQGTYRIPPTVPSNQPQNSATETPSGMRHSFMWHFCFMCTFLIHAKWDFPYLLTIFACIASINGN